MGQKNDIVSDDELDTGFFKQLLNGLEDPIFLKDEHHRWVFVNEAFKNLLSADDIVGKTDSDVLPAEQCEEFYAGDRFVLFNQKSLTQEEPIGPEVWGLVKKSPITLPNGRKGILGIIIDITEYRSMRLEVEALRFAKRQALHDPLTDLPNRRNLQEHFEDLKWQEGDNGSNVYVMHIDLDGFKAINDENGHAVGDAVLVQVAHVITSSISDDMFAARIGGDEFVVVFCPSYGSETAISWAEKFINAVQQPMKLGDSHYSVGASVGLASAREVDFDLDAMLHAADVALYRAKTNGKNRAELYTADLAAEFSQRQMLEKSIDVGLETGAFFPHYQPQFDITTGAFAGVEVLARWNSPQGIRRPADFMDVLEGIKRTDQLDIMILDRALEEITELKAKGFDVQRAAFNVSKIMLDRSDLVEIFAAHTPFPCCVAVELSETISFDGIECDASEKIAALRNLGCEIEIDDFGTNRASITGVMNLRPDRVKLDMHLIRPFLEDQTRQDVVRAILQITEAMGIPAVAEGVETDAHTKILSDMGCAHGQGYAYAKPMSAKDLMNFPGIQRTTLRSFG